MKLLFTLLLISISLAAVAQTDTNTAEQSAPVTLNVSVEPAQKLDGFGCSLVDLNQAHIPEKDRTQMFDRVFNGLHMTVLRLWVGSGPSMTVATMKAQFYPKYVDDGVIAEAQKYGVTTLLLAPAFGHRSPGPIPEYTKKLADFILALRNERGIQINVTGVANEPGLTPQEMDEAVTHLRTDLDARGLQNVSIIAPESASADGGALKVIKALRNDSAAWTDLRGIATHSYNMAVTADFGSVVRGTGKEYWMTEASDNGNEGPDDANRASTITARFLNDINHGVTHWIYFIGFEASPDVATDKDNATKLMVFDRKSDAVVSNLKYNWFRQLRAAFPDGSNIYPLTSAPGGQLDYTYGLKPMLNAAAAKRPDGGWSLGAVNLTDVQPDSHICQFHPAQKLTVTWNLPGLTTEDAQNFRVFRSDTSRRFIPDGNLIMHHGRLTFDLAPRELITLQSDPK